MLRRLTMVSKRPLASQTPALRRAAASTPAPEPQADPSLPPMLRYQTHLPKLPVPPLKQTLDLYLTTLKPHLSPQEYAKSASIVKDFESSEVAKTLQTRLESRANDEGRDSWLSEWWNSYAYMSYRDPVVPGVNYFYVHKGKGGGNKTQSRRAAELVRALEVFRQLTESQQLEPERVRQTPLDMSAYVNMFNASRIPAIPEDTSIKYPTSNGQNDHVVVLRKNRAFKVRVGGLGVEEIDRLFNDVIHTVGADEGPAVGLLTSENRDNWTKARDHLISISKTNAETLEAIQSAIVVVALDDSDPTSSSRLDTKLNDRSWRLWVGEGGVNRWFDKHQLIVLPSGRSGFNGEHSLLDGTPTLRLNEFIIASLEKGKVDLVGESGKKGAAPVELKWVLDDKAKASVEAAAKAHWEIMGRHNLEALQYGGYGKDLIKHYKCSPDAWAQLVMHLAFFNMEGRMGVCYESAQTRKFKEGRTEVIRSSSQEAKDWIESMVREGENDTKRVELFRKAVTRHLEYAAKASNGQGVDRHLFGLKKVLKDNEELPEFFKDPAYAKTSHWEMSTSQLGSEYIDGWGYGEVVDDGYGLGYSVHDSYLRWVITSQKHMRGRELKENIVWACGEVRGMMERAEIAASASASASAKL
ncbi:acyltransferase ChoActase/COT/CPT [Mrakia frigida]|uniref:choline/carnitine O-acyltransferase n=1 Tax=Mrakia frigida TaxID=29902 RepID=UPI003FCC064A